MSDDLLPGECWLNVAVPYAGLTSTSDVQLADNIRLAMIFEENLPAMFLPIIRDVQLGYPDNDRDFAGPVFGLRYRVRGRDISKCAESELLAVSNSNRETVAKIETAFERAIAVMFGTAVLRTGEVVSETLPDGSRARRGWETYSVAIMSHDFVAAEITAENAPHLCDMFNALRLPYFEAEGVSIGVAADRFISALSRTNPLDTNLDLCIAAEIIFIAFGDKGVNSPAIANRTAQNAAAFLGDSELLWTRTEISEIVDRSYKERSDTVHGRRGLSLERARDLTDLNSQLREIIKAALRVFVNARPSTPTVRHILRQRTAIVEGGGAMPTPIVDALTSAESAALRDVQAKVARMRCEDRVILDWWMRAHFREDGSARPRE